MAPIYPFNYFFHLFGQIQDFAIFVFDRAYKVAFAE